MPVAVCFAFAVADGLTPVVGAAPFDVLARQLPRLLVARLNGEGDKGLRFFPFLGPVDGQRSFLRLRELLEPSALCELHKQGDVELLVDGLVLQDRLQWRVLDGHSGKERLRLELPFEAKEPLALLSRLEFEMVGLLQWTGRAATPLALTDAALGWYLVLRDEMLRREANLPDVTPDPLRCANECIALASDDDDVQDVVLDYLALLLRRKIEPARVAAAALQLAPALRDPRRLDRLAGLTFAAGEREPAVKLLVDAAILAPTDAELVERAAALAFQLGDNGAVKRAVEAARGAGSVTPKMMAQLAASCDRSGDLERRQELIQELLGCDELPVPVARLVVSFLLEEEQPALARTVLERALALAPDQAMLHFELGRACLMLDDVARAGIAMQRAIELGLQPALHTQAVRMRRLAASPGLWHGSQLVEKALAAGDLGAARDAIRALVRRAASVAESWLMYGVVEHKRGKHRRAERLLRRALDLDADCAEAANRLGVVLLQAGRTAEGTRHLQRANELSPDDTSTLLHLAQATAIEGSQDKANQLVDRAAQLGADPQLVEAVRREVASAVK
ncbi:MAG: tetratricopeptide repeat protein [Planctomycetota bacterium]